MDCNNVLVLQLAKSELLGASKQQATPHTGGTLTRLHQCFASTSANPTTQLPQQSSLPVLSSECKPYGTKCATNQSFAPAPVRISPATSSVKEARRPARVSSFLVARRTPLLSDICSGVRGWAIQTTLGRNTSTRSPNCRADVASLAKYSCIVVLIRTLSTFASEGLWKRGAAWPKTPETDTNRVGAGRSTPRGADHCLRASPRASTRRYS